MRVNKRVQSVFGALLAISAITSTAWADFSAAFKAIPEDAVLVLSLKSIAETDRKVSDLIKKLEMSEMVPASDISLAQLIIENMEPGDQFDANGSMSLVVLKPDNVMMAMEQVLILAPTKNAAKMLEDMEATKLPSGIWEVTRQGSTAYATPRGTHVAFSPSEEVVEALAESESKKSLADHMSPEAIKGMADLDFVCWMNVEEIVEAASAEIAAFKPLLTMATDPNDPFSVASQKQTMQSIDMMLEGLAGLSLGLGLQPDGIPIRMVLYAKPNTEMGRRFELAEKVEGSAKLNGLPKGEYLFAFASVTSPEALQPGFDDFGPYLDAIGTIEEIDQEKFSQAKDSLKTIMTSTNAMSGVMHILPESAKGVIGASIVLDVIDSAAYCNSWAAFVENSKAIVSEMAGDEFAEYIKPLTFTVDAGKVGDIPYHALGYDMTGLMGLEEEDIEALQELLGPDGLSFRLIPVNKTRVATVFGGGDEFAKLATEAAASDEAPLANDPGIKTSMSRMPSELDAIAVLALDRLLKVVNRGIEAMDEEPLPIEVPKLNEPLSIGSLNGKGWGRVDYYIPMELIVAAKDASMTFMGMNMDAVPADTEPEQ